MQGDKGILRVQARFKASGSFEPQLERVVKQGILLD